MDRGAPSSGCFAATFSREGRRGISRFLHSYYRHPCNFVSPSLMAHLNSRGDHRRATQTKELAMNRFFTPRLDWAATAVFVICLMGPLLMGVARSLGTGV